MTTDTLGGIHAYTLNLTRELAAAGWEIKLATMGPPPTPAQRAMLRSVPGLQLFESTYRLEWMEDPWRDVDAAGEWLLEIERQTRPDVVHLNGYCHAALPWNAPVIVTGHACLLSWWQAVFGESPPQHCAEYRFRVSRGLAAASALVTPTRAMQRSLAANYGALPPAFVIGNGVRVEDWNAGTKEPLFFATGRLWDRAKNLAMLDAIASELPWRVGIAGERCAIELPRSARIDLLGVLEQSELASRLSRAAVFIHPARYEPFGIAVVEAACSGCALVLGDLVTLREVWGDAAIYVDPSQPYQLLAAAQQLAGDHATRRELGRRARARARSYRIERSARAYIELYSRVAHDACMIGEHADR
jgi:glycogen synthase